jgi:hypothetical protein
MTLRSQPSEGCASASFATSAHQITRNIAGTVSARNGKPRGRHSQRTHTGRIISYGPVPAAGAGAGFLFPNICAAIFIPATAMPFICC